MKVVAIIPARSGSVRLKNKNRKKLRGISLIDWSLNFAKKLKFIDDIIVSSNDKRILKEIRKKKDSVKTFFRPNALSRNNSKTVTVILHTLHKYEKKFGKICSILLLQPTSPFRSVTKTYIGYKKYKFYKKKKSVISVSKKKNLSKRCFKIKDSNLILSNNAKEKKLYQVNGNFYFASPSFLKKYKSFYYKDKTCAVILKSNKLSLDIDTKKDFIKAKNYL